MAHLSPESVFLWLQPMFHCNGWCFGWAVTAVGGRHVTIRSVDDVVWDLVDAEGVTNFNGAPTVQLMVLNHAKAHRVEPQVTVVVAAAPPSATLFARMDELNFRVVHVYGLTETYGPITMCPEQEEWRELPAVERATLLARQGQAYPSADLVRVVDDRMDDVPRDGTTMGEVVMRGNNVMAGYFDDPEATATAFRGGWFHSGDLAVWHPDGRSAPRPRQGHHHLRRREHLLDRGRADDRRAPGRARVCGRRRPSPALGRAAEGVRDAQGRCGRKRGRDHRLRARAARPLQVPGRDRVRPAAEDLDREGAEVRAARGGVGRAKTRVGAA